MEPGFSEVCAMIGSGGRCNRASRRGGRLDRIVGICVVTFVLVAGCGPSGRRTLEVNGSVTIDGQPVKVGQITFDVVDEADLGSSSAIADGTYRMKVTPGRKRVRVSALDTSTMSQGGNDSLKPDAKPKEAKELVPKKYAEQPLEIEVTKSGVHDIQLTSD